MWMTINMWMTIEKYVLVSQNNFNIYVVSFLFLYFQSWRDVVFDILLKDNFCCLSRVVNDNLFVVHNRLLGLSKSLLFIQNVKWMCIIIPHATSYTGKQSLTHIHIHKQLYISCVCVCVTVEYRLVVTIK